MTAEQNLRVAMRLGIATILIAGLAVGYRIANGNQSAVLPRWSGELILCDHTCPIKMRPHVLATGLESPRGVAFDATTHRVWVVEGTRPLLLVYNTVSGKFENLPENQLLDQHRYCPAEACQSADRRGIDANDCVLWTADHSAKRIRGAGPNSGACTLGTTNFAAIDFQGPSGVVTARSGDSVTMYATDDRPLAGAPSAGSLTDSIDYWRWRENGEARPFGSVLAIDRKSSHVITDRAHHPSGIALSPNKTTLYVAESDTDGTRWSIFQSAADNWTARGLLGVSAKAEGSIPPFRGIAATDKHVFAAGPDGLYIFSTDGTALGRLVLDDVTGVACGRENGAQAVYFAAGHSLYRAVY